ncbi:MAG: DUF1593 domain-containing protein [Akkermansiaceae bacterium]|nr:DUF1593 domain-containing protein [Verrucomicrobiales bacterium]
MTKLCRLLLTCVAFACLGSANVEAEEKPRVLVLTDIANEPDDEESLVRFLVYANEFDIEGLVATTSTWLKNRTREDLIRRQIAAYSAVRPNLMKHAPGYPSVEQLLAVTTTGQTNFGMPFVGEGKSTAGSKLIITATDHPDPRPLWITIWGGANTLAQALSDVRSTRTAAELKAFVSKLRVYTISDQDDAGPWVRREFPDLFYIVSPSAPDNGSEYWRATWTGISGDRHYKNGPGHKLHLVQNPWLEENIIKNHGPLGALYPKVAYIMEGDTPSFLGLINNGLGWAVSPSFGGWGGRYVLYRASGETRRIWTNNAESRDTVTADNGQTVTSDQATLWRWREHFQNDFAARMDWCVATEYSKANHNPRAVLNGDLTRNVITLSATNGATLALSAEGTSDPDTNSVRVTWWIYPEAGNSSGATLNAEEGLKTEVRLPQVKRATRFHVILQAEDDGDPHLFSYRRAIIEVSP